MLTSGRHGAPPTPRPPPKLVRHAHPPRAADARATAWRRIRAFVVWLKDEKQCPTTNAFVLSERKRLAGVSEKGAPRAA